MTCDVMYKGFDIAVAIIPPTGLVFGDVRMYAQSPRGKRAAKWFCSEAIADCLGYRDAWRFDPNTLFVVLRRANDFNNKKEGE